MSLYERIVAFSKPILDEWVKHQPAEHTPESVQQRFIYSMGKGALLTAMSANRMLEENLYHDLPVLSRVLYERYVKAEYARLDTGNAVVLMIHEAQEQMKRLKLYDPHRGGGKKSLQGEIDKIPDQIKQLKELLDGDCPNALSMFELSKGCGFESMYRGAYNLLSRSVHASYHSGIEDVNPNGYIKYFIHVIPVEISHYLHMVVHGEVIEGHDVFRKEIADTTLGRAEE